LETLVPLKHEPVVALGAKSGVVNRRSTQPTKPNPALEPTAARIGSVIDAFGAAAQRQVVRRWIHALRHWWRTDMLKVYQALGLMFVVAFARHSVPLHGQSDPNALVGQLGDFRAALQGSAPANRAPDPMEERRRELYAQLLDLGDVALPALISGLRDDNVQLRRNVALFLGVAAGSWYERSRPRLNIQPALPALIVSLEDPDDRVRGLAAQAVGEIGPGAEAAVPALIRLLSNPSVGSRNTACIGLRGIGPAAKSALPALRNALSDPDPDVRGFAERAIQSIERH
jgi:hypothetical protein